ncbi:toxin Doc [Streptomyces sp. NPDC051976]|uniref:toxin Doc n=1 Tax=Streptomyces sp. NPDC051976 TaxID=3154947 RepID=UPI003431EBFD
MALHVDVRWLLERQAEVLSKEPSVHDFSGLVAPVARHRVNTPRLDCTADSAWRAAVLFHEIASVRPLPTRNALSGALVAVAYMAASGEAVDTPYGALSDLAKQVRAGRTDVYACADQIRRWRI